MVYSFINFDFYNSKYRDILKIAISNSECFGFFTLKHIRKKDHPDSYFDYLDRLNNSKISVDKVNPPRYTSGQQFSCYGINKSTEPVLNEPFDFTAWNGYDYPEDLVFYKNNKAWLRCISHERMVLINEANIKALDEIKKLGIDLMQIKDTNSI